LACSGYESSLTAGDDPQAQTITGAPYRLRHNLAAPRAGFQYFSGANDQAQKNAAARI
jgi:hypothetical protein